MKHLPVATLLPFALLLGACSTGAITSAAVQTDRDVTVSLLSDPQRETILLVSLEDGSVIKQTIFSSADLCFKKSSDSLTTCLTQGAPVFASDSNTIIGYEMIEEHIELVAKSN